MINRPTAERVANIYCTIIGQPGMKQAVANVLTNERTRIVLNSIIEQISEKVVYLPSNEPKQINELIAQVLKDTALNISKKASNEISNN